jgi:hypothetical protein
LKSRWDLLIGHCDLKRALANDAAARRLKIAGNQSKQS